MGTKDARVIALDAKSGSPCGGFGTQGEVKLDIGIPLEWPGEFQITSAPVVVRVVVIVGSSIADNRRVEAPRGTVRAFDARSGQLRWTWEPLERQVGHRGEVRPLHRTDHRATPAQLAQQVFVLADPPLQLSNFG
jgi:quinoprotein glucose dehydrogenase